MGIAFENKELLFQYKDLIKQYNYRKLFDQLIDTGMGKDQFAEIINFLYNDCNIDFLKYLGYKTRVENTELIDTDILDVPSNLSLSPIHISGTVKTLKLHINSRINSEIEVIVSRESSVSLDTIYIDANCNCSITLRIGQASFINLNSISSFKNLYIGSNITAITNFLELFDSYPNLNIYIEQNNRTIPFKIPAKFKLSTQIKFVNSLNESLNEDFQKNLPVWLIQELKQKAKKLSANGFDPAGRVLIYSSKDNLPDAFFKVLNSTDIFVFFCAIGDMDHPDPSYGSWVYNSLDNQHTSLDNPELGYILQKLRNQISSIDPNDYIEDKDVDAINWLSPKEKEYYLLYRDLCNNQFSYGMLPVEIFIDFFGPIYVLQKNSDLQQKKQERRTLKNWYLANISRGNDRAVDLATRTEVIKSYQIILDKYGYASNNITSKLKKKLIALDAINDETATKYIDKLYDTLDITYKEVQRYIADILQIGNAISKDTMVNVNFATNSYGDLLNKYTLFIDFVEDENYSDPDINRYNPGFYKYDTYVEIIKDAQELRQQIRDNLVGG